MSNKIVYTALTVFLTIFWAVMLALGIKLAPKEHRVDCSMAEFHPDITPKEREKCRQLRSTKL